MFVYILYSRSLEKYYTGHSENALDRLKRHNAGNEKHTKTGVPWEMIWQKQVSTRSEAMKLELRIKKRGAKRFLDNPLGA